MPNPAQTTLNPSSRNGPVNQLDYIIQSKLYDINTMLPCEIIGVLSNGGQTFYNAQSLINPRNAKGQPALDENGIPVPPPILYNVTAGIIAGNNCAIIVPYAVGDKVWIDFCQRDITNTKDAKFVQTTPASARALSLSDGVIKCHVDDGSNYTTTITFGANGAISMITPSGQPISINSGGDVDVTTTNKASITANEVDILSGNVNLGNSGGSGVLTAATTFTITGITAGSDTVVGTITANTPSTKVKAIL
jgi:hypothetical protein